MVAVAVVAVVVAVRDYVRMVPTHVPRGRTEATVGRHPKGEREGRQR